jgi:hypothetical protein
MAGLVPATAALSEGAGLEEILDRHDLSPERFTGAGLPNCRAGWLRCATGRAFWPAVIARKRCPDSRIDLAGPFFWAGFT